MNLKPNTAAGHAHSSEAQAAPFIWPSGPLAIRRSASCGPLNPNGENLRTDPVCSKVTQEVERRMQELNAAGALKKRTNELNR